MDKNFICKLALERCRVHVTHLHALTHLSFDENRGDDGVREGVCHLIEGLSRALALVEDSLSGE